jgi:pilus assembly protein CpaF
MYFYKKTHGKEALTVMIREYKLDALRFEIEDKEQGSYLMTSDDINKIYDDKNFQLDINSMLDVITILIFQRYKGFGIIDTIREMNVNGVNCGASGSVLASILSSGRSEAMTAPRSVWLHFEGKQIHMRFLTFGTEDELRRVVQLVGRYGKSAPLTEKLGYKVSTMYDKSRVLSLRPPASEYWAMFVRKFTLPEVNLSYLLDPKDKNTGARLVQNPDLPAELIRYIMRGQLTTVITGRQGTGKTTNMMAWVKYIDPRLTLRILEMVFELYLRELYPERNIMSVQETEYVTPQALQDALKKSDGQVTMIGEIATDTVASRFIQNTQISSPFSIASHHGMTTKSMLQGLGNSHSSASGIPSAIALQQVVDAVPMNAHLNIRYDGVRYFEHFTEIIPIVTEKAYPKVSRENIVEAVASLAEIQREFSERQTQKEIFRTNKILSFDVESGKYYPENWFSEHKTIHLLDRMTTEDRESMLRFADEYWGSDKHRKPRLI